MPTTGLELKLQRIARDVKAKDLAARMSVTPARVSLIEGRRVVSEDVARAYLESLATFTSVADDRAA